MKKLLALAPLLPQVSDLDEFSDSLAFLQHDYTITWLDPLCDFKGLSYELYTRQWIQKIKNSLDDFDVYIGFSIGALLIQQAFDCFVNREKKIILFSPPTVMTNQLQLKLGRVLTVLGSGATKEALDLLYKDVFLEPIDFKKKESESWSVIVDRLEYGLGYLMESQVGEKIRDSKLLFHQFVGEGSELVTSKNLCPTVSSVTHLVPKAGMRVLDDNPDFCQKKIKEYLNDCK